MDGKLDYLSKSESFRRAAKNDAATSTEDAKSLSDVSYHVNDQFGKKIFRARPTLYNELAKHSKHARAIYNFAVGMFSLNIMRDLAETTVKNGWPSLQWGLIWYNFSHLHWTLFLWFLMFLSCNGIYTFFRHIYVLLPEGKVFNVPCILLLVLYYILFITLPFKSVIKWDLTPASSLLIAVEQCRMIMKIHAFIKDNYQKPLESDFNKFTYFMFAPTLIYRHHYPRLKSCNYYAAAKHFGEFFLCIVWGNYIFQDSVTLRFQDYGPDQFSLHYFVTKVFESCLDGLLCLLLLFWGLVHGWANAWCELMRFADRHYYNDWWNSTRMSSYYRDWNLVVYEWLYTYIYKDVAIRFTKSAGTYVVFFFSALAHEYWFIVGLRQFCPVIFIMYFIFGPIMFFISRVIKADRAWNTIMFSTLVFGQGMFITVYAAEYYARHHGKCQRYFV